MTSDDDKAKADLADLARARFCRLGIDYYVVGRFAALSGIFPVAGNQLHHAVEMLLKGALIRTRGLREVRKYSHDLSRLWDDFKSQIAGAGADAFDLAIRDLHKFEGIRYLDRVMEEGMHATFAVTRDERGTQSDDKVPVYGLTLEDVDELVKFIFNKAGWNPQVFVPPHKEARAYLALRNLHPLG